MKGNLIYKKGTKFSLKLASREQHCTIVPKRFHKVKAVPFTRTCGIARWTFVAVLAVPRLPDRQITETPGGRAPTRLPPAVTEAPRVAIRLQSIPKYLFIYRYYWPHRGRNRSGYYNVIMHTRKWHCASQIRNTTIITITLQKNFKEWYTTSYTFEQPINSDHVPLTFIEPHNQHDMAQRAQVRILQLPYTPIKGRKINPSWLPLWLRRFLSWHNQCEVTGSRSMEFLCMPCVSLRLVCS